MNNPVFPAGSASPRLRSRLREAVWPNFRADTARFRSSPSFLILGADQSGTTTLWRYLGKHRQVLPSTRRNVGYFGDSFYQGANWYRSHFPLKGTLAARSQLLKAPCITGECSNHYLWTAASAPRIQSELPSVKLLVMLRDPVARAVAHHRHNTAIGIERRNFERCVGVDLELIERLGSSNRAVPAATPRRRSVRLCPQRSLRIATSIVARTHPPATTAHRRSRVIL